MNINEIAALAGVSRATVSRYLNNGYVSAEKKESIRKIIEKTGYQPSAQAQMLRTKKTKLIGVILPKINSHTISRMVAGISSVLADKGYQLLLANTNNDIEEELKYLHLFKDNQVDGIIFIATIFTTKHKKLLKECRVPIVILAQKLSGFNCVYHDDYQASYEMSKLLLEKGDQIGYIGVTDKDEAVGMNRRRGFEQAIKEAGKAIADTPTVVADFSMEDGYAKMKELLKQEPRMDSVLCATDNLAIGAMKYLKEIGKEIPKDIQLAGMGDTLQADLMEPKITTIHFHYKTSGIEAASMLVQLIEEEGKTNKELKMGYQIIKTSSIKSK